MSKWKLTAKITVSIVTTLAVASVVGFVITQNRINAQAESAFVDKLRKTDGMAGTIRTYFSANVDVYVPNHEFKQVKQVPVVVAWNIARNYAESQGMKFSTPSLHPRDPQHAPDGFEREALMAFEANSELKEFYKHDVIDGLPVMRYAQPVRLTKDCLLCHGDPAGTKDPFGYVREGMKEGDLRGAFVVTAPLESLRKASLDNSLTLLLIGLATLVAASGVVFFIVRRFVVTPISGAVVMAAQIADNNLAAKDIRITSADEIADAGNALNRMKTNLHQLIQAIATTAEHLASASEELSCSAAQQSGSAETQKDQTVQVATAMQQMSATVSQVSENSNRAAEASREAAETARQGGVVVEETLTKMRNIAHSVEGTAKKMDELGKSSDQIGRIAGVIDDIADQTNLLALNAAIEAARAGAQGRGFAVVADEVRKLAERTTNATKEIAQMIKNIQAETKAAVTAMEADTRQVEDGVKTTTQAGESLKKIIQMSEEVGEMITNIATAATEQSSASEEINKNMDQIAKLVNESAVGSQESARACQDLSGLALDLQTMVSRFKLDDSDSFSLESLKGRPGAGDPTSPRAALRETKSLKARAASVRS
jgi:methyl-accepting chemotaxis protein